MDYQKLDSLLGQVRDACNEGIRRARVLASSAVEGQPLTSAQIAALEQAIRDAYQAVKVNVLPQLDAELM
ncbi:MAG: hypothetical protein HY535_06955 [Chloroflexi bacterium]|nr:hypothetical protein [Chloroflexota bacterium]